MYLNTTVFYLYALTILSIHHLSGIYENDAGYLVPEECVTAHLNAAKSHGADLHFNEIVVSWKAIPHTSTSSHTTVDSSNANHIPIDENQENKTLYEVTTTHGEGNLQTSTYLTYKIVLAVGPWAPALYGSEIPVQLHVERRVQFWFQPINPNLFKVYYVCYTFLAQVCTIIL